MPTEKQKPRNAYEEAVLLRAKLKEQAGRLEGGAALVKSLDELWRLFEACIPDADKPGKENP